MNFLDSHHPLQDEASVRIAQVSTQDVPDAALGKYHTLQDEETCSIANVSPRGVPEVVAGASNAPAEGDIKQNGAVLALTFLRPSGKSEVVKFSSTPLCFRFSRAYPYVVTDVAAELELHATSMIQPRWVLTHVNHEKLPEVWSEASPYLKEALQALSHSCS